MLANMLKLVMTLGLVSLATSIDDDPFDILRTLGIYPSDHITVSTRVQPEDLRLFNGPHYYIPSGECLAYLDTDHLCGKEGLKGIEVKVSDPHDFARVVIQPKKGLVRILRRGHIRNGTLLLCPDSALVDLRLSCDHWKFSHSRNRPRLPLIPLRELPLEEDLEDVEDVEDVDEETLQ